MMTTSTVFLAGMLFVSGGETTFKEFSPAGGRFKVLMPPNPQLKTQNTPGGVLKMYLVEEKNGAYMAGFADTPIPANETAVQTQVRLDGARDGAVRNIKGKLTKDTKIKLAGKYEGREIEANLPNQKGVIRARFYIVGSRMYQVMVVGTPEFAGTRLATRFLGSFALTK